MKKKLGFSVIALILLASCSQSLYEFQPNIPWGGRIVALSKDPNNDNKIIAAAPSGGLFLSSSRGSSWSHISLPVFEMYDVEFSPVNSNIVVATAARDLKINNGGGIWRSVDGGKTWAKPPGSVFMKGGSAVASHAFAISFEPSESRKVYVGTEQGVAISNDNGATWKYKSITPLGEINVYCVLAGKNGLALAATSVGIYRSTNGGDNWTFVSNILATASTRSLCYAAANNNNVFLAADGYQIFYSGDFGKTWKEIKSPGGKNREPFVRCTAQPAIVFGTNVKVTYLYYGNGVDLYRKILPNAENNNGNVFFANEWVKLGLDHTDPSDIVFSNDGTSLLLSGDGGVFNTADGGENWSITGGGNGGLNALQINEATAQENFENGRKYYVYFGTQDNQLWTSLNGGSSWTAYGNEGHSLQTKRRALQSKGNLMALALDDSITQYGSKQGFVDVADWKEAPQVVGDPVVVPGGDLLDPEPRDRFFQLSFSKGNIGKFAIKLDQYYFNNTNDGGVKWTRIGHMSYAPTAQYPKVSSDGEATVYQPYSTGRITKNGYDGIGLVKLSKTNRVGEGVLEMADGNGYGSLGIFPTEFKWYNVFAVNPTDPNHVIIADVEDGVIKVTNDGGKNWYTERALSDLITNAGSIAFYQIVDCCPKILVTCISFNPDNPNQIAIGTRENGIFFTWDRGNVWYKLDNTLQITNASSIFFYFDGSIMVSTYGRGLWKFKPKRSRTSTELFVAKVYKGAHVFDLATKEIMTLGGLEKEGIGTGERLIVANTSDAGLTISKIIAQKIKTVQINPFGYDSAQQYRNPKQLSLPYEMFGEALRQQFVNDPLLDIPIRAFLYNTQNQATGFVISTETYKLYRPGELVMKEVTRPYVSLLNDSLQAITLLMRNKLFYIEGINFTPTREAEKGYVQIYMDGRLVKERIRVSEGGTFRVGINMSGTFSNGVEIRVVQDVPAHPITIIKNVSVARESERIEREKIKRR